MWREKRKFLCVHYIINSDKEIGTANFKVHFDSSGSSDPDGEIVSYEWYVNGRKAGVGAELNYEFDQVGENIVRLNSINNYGVVTTAIKSITSLQPPVYLNGNIQTEAFVGLLYKCKFITVLAKDVIPEDVHVSLEGAPEGVIYNESTNEVVWTPTDSQLGEYKFKVIITDGVSTSERLFNMQVYKPTVLASVNNNGAGGKIFIHNSDTVFDGTEITLPDQGVQYSLMVIQSNDIIRFHSDSDLKPIHVKFPKTISMNILDHGNSFGEGMNEYLDIKRDAIDILICSNQNAIIQAVLNDRHWEDYKNPTYAWMNFYIDKKLSADKIKQVKGLMDNNEFLNLLPTVTHYNIYFTFWTPSNRHGKVFRWTPDSIFVNMESDFNKVGSLLKRTILHESYHVKQNDRRVCSEGSVLASEKDLSYLALVEGAADYFALKSLDNNTENANVYGDEVLTDREKAISEAYGRSKINETLMDYLFKGILDFGDQGEVYDARILFEKYQLNNGQSFQLDDLALIDFFEKNLESYRSQADIGKKVLKDYSIKYGLDLDRFFLAIQNGSSYLESLKLNSKDLVVFPFLKNTSFYNWTPVPVQTVSSSTINLTLPAFTGISRRLEFPSSKTFNLYSSYAIKYSSQGEIAAQFNVATEFNPSFVSFYPSSFYKEKNVDIKLYNRQDISFDLFNIDSSKDSSVTMEIIPMCQKIPSSSFATVVYCENGCANLNLYLSYCKSNTCNGMEMIPVSSDPFNYWGNVGYGDGDTYDRYICQRNYVGGKLFDFTVIQ